MDEGLGHLEKAAGGSDGISFCCPAGSLSASHTIAIEREGYRRTGMLGWPQVLSFLSSLYHKHPPRPTVLRPSRASVCSMTPPPFFLSSLPPAHVRPVRANVRESRERGCVASVCSFLRRFCCTSRGSEAIVCSSAAYVSARAATLRGDCLGLLVFSLLLGDEETSNVRLRLSPIMPLQTYYVT